MGFGRTYKHKKNKLHSKYAFKALDTQQSFRLFQKEQRKMRAAHQGFGRKETIFRIGGPWECIDFIG
jgi:hypothetical protein